MPKSFRVDGRAKYPSHDSPFWNRKLEELAPYWQEHLNDVQLVADIVTTVLGIVDMQCSCGEQFKVVLKPFEHYHCEKCGRKRTKKNRNYNQHEGTTPYDDQRHLNGKT